ncbi:MAG: hypothetical protein IKF09_06150 [Clostridiales bacterium]|nr:hypothetical protein [Clostridiales bacterium]
MFEISVIPEISSRKILSKTPDSVLIINQIKRSGNKAMRAGLKKLEEGSLILDITKKYIDARHGKVSINYRFDFISRKHREEQEKEIFSKALPYIDSFEDGIECKRPVVIGTGPAGL